MEKRIVGGISPRLLQLGDLLQARLGLSFFQAARLFSYGCWCGGGNMGKIVDDFDL